MSPRQSILELQDVSRRSSGQPGSPERDRRRTSRSSRLSSRTGLAGATSLGASSLEKLLDEAKPVLWTDIRLLLDEDFDAEDPAVALGSTMRLAVRLSREEENDRFR